MRRRAAFAVLALATSGCGLVGSSIEASWQLAADAELAETDTSIEIWVIDPHCEDKLTADKVDVEVDETDESVVVTARVPDASGVACKFRQNPVPVVIALTSPLGDRELLVGSQVSNEPPSTEPRGGMPIPLP